MLDIQKSEVLAQATSPRSSEYSPDSGNNEEKEREIWSWQGV